MQVSEYFDQVAKVNAVRMRRHLNSKQFKGSVFVEFVDVETAKKVGASCSKIMCLYRRPAGGSQFPLDGSTLARSYGDSGCVRRAKRGHGMAIQIPSGIEQDCGVSGFSRQD